MVKLNCLEKMKKIISILLVLIVNTTFAQIYLNDSIVKYSEINQRDSFGLQGLWIFSQYSTIYQIENFLNNKLHGSFHYLNSRSIGNYKFGLYDGNIISYYKNGTIRMSTTFTNGVVNGLTSMYSEDGKLLFRVKMNYGVIDSSYSNMFVLDSIAQEEISYYQKSISGFLLNNFDIFPEIDSSTIYYTKNYKLVSIYVNGKMYKEMYVYKNRIDVENYYDDEFDTAFSTEYYKTPPYTLKAIYYYRNQRQYKKDIYYKNGNLKKTIFF